MRAIGYLHVAVAALPLEATVMTRWLISMHHHFASAETVADRDDDRVEEDLPGVGGVLAILVEFRRARSWGSAERVALVSPRRSTSCPTGQGAAILIRAKLDRLSDRCWTWPPWANMLGGLGVNVDDLGSHRPGWRFWRFPCWLSTRDGTTGGQAPRSKVVRLPTRDARPKRIRVRKSG